MSLIVPAIIPGMRNTDALAVVPEEIVRPSRSRQLTIMAIVAALSLGELARSGFRSDQNGIGAWLLRGALVAGVMVVYGWFFWQQRKISYLAVDDSVLIRSDWRGRAVRIPLADLRQATFARVRASRFSNRSDARLVIERHQARPLTMRTGGGQPAASWSQDGRHGD